MTKSGLEVYSDGFDKTFSSQKEFSSFLTQREQEVRWIPEVEVKDISFVGFSKKREVEVTEMLEIANNNYIDYNVVSDTMNNGTRLFAKITTGTAEEKETQMFPISSTAYVTIEERAKIHGKALYDVDREFLAEILSNSTACAGGKALVRVADGKISAILGGDKNEYSIIPSEEVFSEAEQFVNKEFPNAIYLGGYYSHTYVSQEWNLSGTGSSKELETNIGGKIFTPIMKVITSDNGTCSATIKPKLLNSSGKTIPMNTPLKVAHKHGNSLENFIECEKMVKNSFKKGLAKLSDLEKIKITHGKTTMLRVMKKCQVLKKCGLEAAEVFEALYGDSEVTALDIYLSICEVLGNLPDTIKENPTASFRAEDSIARCIGVNWQEYDLAGNFTW